MKQRIFLSAVFLFVLALHGFSQDNLEITGDEPSGYIKANRPYRIDTQDGVLYVFYGRDPHVLVRFPEEDTRTSFTIPNTVVRIARGAFSGCMNLEELIIPPSVYLIGDNSFDNSGIRCFKISDNTDVTEVSNTSSQKSYRYDLSGNPITEDSPGINIIVENGKARKQLIKQIN